MCRSSRSSGAHCLNCGRVWESDGSSKRRNKGGLNAREGELLKNDKAVAVPKVSDAPGLPLEAGRSFYVKVQNATKQGDGNDFLLEQPDGGTFLAFRVDGLTFRNRESADRHDEIIGRFDAATSKEREKVSADLIRNMGELNNMDADDYIAVQAAYLSRCGIKLPEFNSSQPSRP